MLVKFKQAVHLKGKTVKGKDYSRGVHEVCEEHLADPHFHKLVKAGLVEDGEAAKVVAPLSLQERQKQLAEKLAPKPKAPIPPKEELPPAADASAPEAPALEPSANEEQPAPPADPSAEDAELAAMMAEEEKAKAEAAEAEKAGKQKSKQKKG